MIWNGKRNERGHTKNEQSRLAAQKVEPQKVRHDKDKFENDRSKNSQINSTIILKYLTVDCAIAEINLKPLMITNLLCGVYIAGHGIR